MVTKPASLFVGGGPNSLSGELCNDWSGHFKADENHGRPATTFKRLPP